jgi:hypothetical protein
MEQKEPGIHCTVLQSGNMYLLYSICCRSESASTVIIDIGSYIIIGNVLHFLLSTFSLFGRWSEIEKQITKDDFSVRLAAVSVTWRGSWGSCVLPREIILSTWCSS